MSNRLISTAKDIVHGSRVLSAINNVRVRIRDSRYRKAVNSFGAETAKNVVDVLEASGFEPVLTAGTLLGAIRDGAILAHDEDLDIALKLEENSEWEVMQAELEKAGYPLIRQFSYEGHIREQTYRADGFNFDMFGFHRTDEPGMLRAYYFCRREGVEYANDDDRSVMYRDLPTFNVRTSAKLSTTELPIPDNATAVLERLYGPGWRTPDPNWKTGTGWTLVDGAIVHRQVFSRHSKRH